MALKTRIRNARITKGLSQAELGSKLKVSRSAVANWESGNTAPSTAHLTQLSLTTDVSHEWLATGRGSPALQEEWTPAVDAEIIDDSDERRLLHAYREGTKAARRRILEFVASTSPKAKRIIGGHHATHGRRKA